MPIVHHQCQQMVHFWISATLLSLLRLSGSFALFLECQIQKPAGSSPLLGCPLGTIFVSQNISDAYANFHSVQEAVLSLWVPSLMNCA